jgi:hypothetical protein
MKAGVVERIHAAISRQRRGKHVSAETDIGATIEDTVFSANANNSLTDRRSDVGVVG